MKRVQELVSGLRLEDGMSHKNVTIVPSKEKGRISATMSGSISHCPRNPRIGWRIRKHSNGSPHEPQTIP